METNQAKAGDFKRDGRDRPKVIVQCDKCQGTGKVPSEKVAGRLNKCQGCKGEGKREKAYSRMTTFIDVLEDKKFLTDWKQRNVAIGLAKDDELRKAFATLDNPHKDDKQAAMRLIEKAERVAGADIKASTGTALHDIIENINRNLPVGFVPDEHKADIMAYQEALRQEGIKVVAAETRVVNDIFGAAGTFDILCLHKGRLKIGDVKTGRIDYGLSKIGMQLGGYAHSKLYDVETGERSPLTHFDPFYGQMEVDLEEALIIHLPAGEGVCTVVPVDIRGAYDGLLLAQQVRKWRGRKFQQDPLRVVRIDPATLSF